MKVGWIGVGNMGNPMAEHVLAAGHDFKVHDLRQEAAANLLESAPKWAGQPGGGRGRRSTTRSTSCAAVFSTGSRSGLPGPLMGRGLRHSVAIPL